MQTKRTMDGMNQPPRATKWITVLGGFGLCALVLLLATENRRLEATLAEVSTKAAAGGLQAGDQMPTLELVDLSGELVNKEWTGDRSSLLFFFTTTCSACEQNLDRWRETHRRYGNDFEIIGVGLDSIAAVRAYAREQDMPFEVRVANDPYLAKSLGIVGVPETVVVAANGAVEKVHVGLLPDDWEA